jgi:hypothetical protein
MLRVAGDAVLVERVRPRILVLVCPCGCGEELAINVDKQAGRAWRLYQRPGLTMFPSVWRETGCESHFILWKDRIYLFSSAKDERGDEDDALDELWSDEVTINRELVLDALSPNALESLSAIADRLDALPWEVLHVCRRLVADKVAVEGSGVERGHFRRR